MTGLGLHLHVVIRTPGRLQVTAPATEAAPRPGHSQRWRTSLHAQGALAVEGEAHIWRGGSKDKDKEGGSTGSTAAGGSGQAGNEAAARLQDKGSGSGGAGEEAGGSEEPRRTKLASALERAKAADEEPAVPPRKQRRGKKGDAAQQPGGEAAGDGEQPAEGAGPSDQQAAAARPAEEAGAPAQAATAGSDAAAEQPQQLGQPPQRQPGAALESFIRPLEQMGERVSEMGERVSDLLHRHTHPQEQAPQAAGGPPDSQADESGYAASASSDAEEQRVQSPNGSAGSGSCNGGSSKGSGSPHASSLFGGLSSQAITATIQDSAALLQRVKDSVQQLTGNVQVRWSPRAGLGCSCSWAGWV